MDKITLLEQVRAQFPDVMEVVSPDPKFVRGNDELQVKVPSSSVSDIASFLKKTLKFDFLNFMTAVDYVKENRFELVYHFMSSSEPVTQIFVKTDLPREGEPSVPSIAPLYASADWQERETYDLFGIRFDGHPNHKRILLWEGYPGWPLRKDYVHVQDKYDNGSEIGLPKIPGVK
ncbi:MAG: NADH-quinone oxidoreductase subunit C [Elusimicrobia bacterium]|nr:NADH-quinone oxidoreductase subunit C [Elusimicrobiota bacterium]